MTRRFKIPFEQIIFSPVCVVCGAATGDKLFPIEKTFFIGRRAVPVTVMVPMCAEHFRLSSAKSSAQRWVERGGVALGALVGLGVAAALIAYWSTTGQAVNFFTSLLALFVGIGFFLTVWIATTSWLAPRFSAPATKAARGMVRLTKYWVNENVLELEFSHNGAASSFLTANRPALIGLKPYRLRSGLLCHDVRLNTHISLTVMADQAPTEEEAMHLLWPVGEAEVTRNFCEDCPFDLLGITVEEG